MWLFVILVCLGLALIIADLHYTQFRSSEDVDVSPRLKSFQTLYFIVYVLANSSDWLQGPYVYALYEYYGHDKDAIALLFIAGFVSSMLFGTFFGSLADIYGRKTMALSFCAIYALSCLTKLSGSFWVLLFGRLTGGIATSLLFSVFESWMVHEHRRNGFDQTSLDSIFSKSAVLNSLAAISSGLAASLSASFFGFTAPFILAFLLLLVLTAIVYFNWQENYGNQNVKVLQNISEAAHAIKTNSSILLLGVVQSLFEGSMYVFVFLWTPTLAETEPDAFKEGGLHGLIFAAYMLAVMLASTLSRTISNYKSPPELMRIILFASAATFLVPAFVSNPYINFIAFIVFEFCCGLYFPTAGSLRSLVIPEDSRTTIMALYRMGLNILVVFALKGTGSLPTGATFTFCALWLIAGGFMMKYFPHVDTEETHHQIH